MEEESGQMNRLLYWFISANMVMNIVTPVTYRYNEYLCLGKASSTGI